MKKIGPEIKKLELFRFFYTFVPIKVKCIKLRHQISRERNQIDPYMYIFSESVERKLYDGTTFQSIRGSITKIDIFRFWPVSRD